MDRVILHVRLITGAYFTFVVFVIICAINNWYGPVFEQVRQTAGDKLMHFLMVGMLTFLINLSMRAMMLRLGIFPLQLGTLLLLVLTTLEEFSQLMFVNRTFDLLDLACNVAGIILLGGLAWPVASWLGIRKKLAAV